MKTISEEKFETMFTSYQENMVTAKLNIYYNMDNLRMALRTASGGLSDDSGVAYEGGLLSHINLTIAIARSIMEGDMFSKLFKNISWESVLKVICLQHLSKIEMFERSDDYSTKRGYPFKFRDSLVYLKAGERSILNAMNLGVRFTDEEFEAMKILDKEEGKKVSDSSLSMLVKSANEFAFAYEKERWKASQR